MSDKKPLQGWVCPVCGRGVSPFVSTCDHGGNPRFIWPFWNRSHTTSITNKDVQIDYVYQTSSSGGDA